VPLSLLLTAFLTVSSSPSGAEASAPGFVKPLPGRCAGTKEVEEPPPGNTPTEALPQPWTDDLRLDFAAIGDTPAADGKTLRAKDGAPVSKETLDWLMAPEDFSSRKVHYLIWMYLVQLGYDLDENSCVMQMVGRGPLTRLQYSARVAEYLKASQFGELEQLGAQFENTAGPLPASARTEKQRFEKLLARLPPDLARKIENATARRADVLQAYTDATNAFDAARVNPAFSKHADGPASTQTPAHPPQATSEELALSNLLTSELRALIGQTDHGQQFLDLFKSRSASLPMFGIQRLSQDAKGFAGGFFVAYSGRIVFDYDQSIMLLTAGLPEAEQKRLSLLLKTPEDVRRYIVQSPEAMKRFSTDLLGTSFHELVHYFQSLTTEFGREALYGNVPSAYPIEYEHEAFRDTCVFMSERELDHDDGDAGWAEVSKHECLLLLSDYGRFAGAITHEYAAGYGATTVKDIARMQELRRRTAQKLMTSDDVIERLKLSGFLKGDRALRQLSMTIAQRTAVFEQSTLPAHRRLVRERLIPRAAQVGRPDTALALASAFKPETPGWQDSISRWLTAALPLFAKPNEHFPIALRVTGYSYAAYILKKENKHWPASLIDAYSRDARVYSDDPGATWGPLALMAPDQPGRSEANAAWLKGAESGLRSPSVKFTPSIRLDALALIAQDHLDRRRQLSPELMNEIKRDLAVPGMPPLEGLAVVSRLPKDQRGRTEAVAAWRKSIQGALLDPQPDFSLEYRMYAWTSPDAIPPAALRGARDRDAVAYAAVLLTKARAENDPEKRRALLNTAWRWTIGIYGVDSLPAAVSLKAQIQRELRLRP
jgi:hypothetical protein